MSTLALLGPLALFGCQAPPDAGGDSGRIAWDEAVYAEARAPDDLLAVVGEPVTLDGSASEGGDLTWDLGDGTTTGGAVIEHTWTAAGRYLVTLTADGDPPDSDSLHVTVVDPPLDPAPVASGMLVGDGNHLYAALPDFDQVAVIDLTTGASGADVAGWLDVCDQPRSLALAGGELAVACRDGAQRWTVGTPGEEVLVEEVEVPAGAVLLHDGLWVLGADGTLHGPEETVSVLRGRTLVGWEDTVATAAFLAEEDHAPWVTVSDDGVVDGRIARDPGPDSDTNARGVPNLLGAGALRPDGGVVVFGGLKANTERGLFVEGTELEHDNAVRASVEVLDPLTGAEQEGPLFDNRDRVGALAFTPMGDKLLVAHHGAGVVDVLDALTWTRVGGFQGVGTGLDGLWTDGEVAWVLVSLERRLVAFDLTAGNDQVELADVALVEDEVLSADALWGAQLFHAAGDPRMSTDAYISCGSCHPDGGQDGRVWDFTQRGEGLRNTLAIWAMPPDGPFHWSANFDELQDFENDIRLHQAGDGFLAETDWTETQEPLGPEKAGRSAELDAMAAYMQHLADTAAPLPPGADDGTGRAAFEAAGCADCHGGDRGTDAAWEGEDGPVLHDVGTLTEASGQRLGGDLTGLRTPGLTGVAWTGPWLHDGSAASLEAAVLAHDGIDLYDDELDRILAYLRSL